MFSVIRDSYTSVSYKPAENFIRTALFQIQTQYLFNLKGKITQIKKFTRITGKFLSYF